MKKVIGLSGIALSIFLLTGCEGMVTNWRGRNAVRTAESMEIIKQELSEDYLIHFWIRTLENHDNVIYVATELGLPVIMGSESILD